MDIIKHLEDAKANIIADKERQVAIIKQQVTSNVSPKFSEIEKLKSESESKLATNYNHDRDLITQDYNAQLISRQKRYEQELALVKSDAEKRKKEIFDTEMATATCGVLEECNNAVNLLDNHIKKLKG